MVIFRENTEDIYAGIEFEEGTDDAKKFARAAQGAFPRALQEDPLPGHVGHRHQAGLARRHRAPRARRDRVRDRERAQGVTLVHKGNIMKFTEGAFRDWGYALAQKEFGAVELDGGPWMTCQECRKPRRRSILVKDAIADAFLQQVLTRPDEFDVIATLNLNGDYLSDALAAQVGGIGIAPGGNINYVTGHAVFEATHGTAPKYAEPGQGQPGLGDPVGRDDAALHGLDRSRRRDHRARWTRRSPRRR